MSRHDFIRLGVIPFAPGPRQADLMVVSGTDVYVPGCPPRPEALLHGILRLQQKIAGESLGERYGPPAPAAPSSTALRRPLQVQPADPYDPAESTFFPR